jgi:type IV pilus assembly protein PilC
MLAAGLSPVQAFDALAEQRGWGQIGRRLAAIRGHVVEGGNLADAFGQFPAVFDPIDVAILRAAEEAGRLEDAFERLADSCRRRAALARKMITGLIYPLVLLHFALLVSPLIQTLRDENASYWRLALPPLAAFYAALALVFAVPRILRQHRSAARFMDSVKDCVPLWSGLVRKLALARFARALEGLLDSGVGLAEALSFAAEASGNELVRGRAERLVPVVGGGERLSSAMKSVGGFPSVLLNLVGTGEQSGHVSKMLGNAARLYEDDAETALGRIAVVLPVVIYLAVAAYVGLCIVRAYASLWSTYAP